MSEYHIVPAAALQQVENQNIWCATTSHHINFAGHLSAARMTMRILTCRRYFLFKIHTYRHRPW
jgi:hypothetical protein